MLMSLLTVTTYAQNAEKVKVSPNPRIDKKFYGIQKINHGKYQRTKIDENMSLEKVKYLFQEALRYAQEYKEIALYNLNLIFDEIDGYVDLDSSQKNEKLSNYIISIESELNQTQQPAIKKILLQIKNLLSLLQNENSQAVIKNSDHSFTFEKISAQFSDYFYGLINGDIEHDKKIKISLYPNPISISDQFKIDMGEVDESDDVNRSVKVRCIVVNSSGKIVSDEYMKFSQLMTFQAPSSVGSYFVKIIYNAKNGKIKENNFKLITQ